MSKSKKHNGAIEFAIILMFFGVVAILLSLVVFPMLVTNHPEMDHTAIDKAGPICLYAGIGVCAVALIVLIAGIVVGKKAKAKQAAETPKPEVMPDAEVSMETPTAYNGSTVTYVPSCEAQTFMDMGSRQSVDEKFEQIAKMDKTQFVIYVARLFSCKGYQVKLTPVFDNYNIDMLVEKMGVVIAVGCILTDKILGEADVRKVAEGKTHYQASNVMTLTNMYFDRTALDFAKANKMSLVDRVILTEDFMN